MRRKKRSIRPDVQPEVHTAVRLAVRPAIWLAGTLLLSLTSYGDFQLFAQSVDFVKEVRPIFEERCFACHGALKQESSLRLDSAKLLNKGGDSGTVVDRKNAKNSELILRLVEKDESLRMPPEGKPLTESEVNLIRRWIEQGAVIPANDFAEASPEDHWAFQVPRKIKLGLPTTTDEKPNPIDQLLELARSRKGLNFQSESVSDNLLLRRVYLDLIGVPPTLQEQIDFQNNSRPDAFEDVVDRLLASPQYGERWGRHWMDVWRYTDWYGLGDQLRNSQKHIWHWRDWIVESLNNDSGYDQMVTEMLAADELYPTDLQRLRATGFLARNYYLFNRTTWLDSTIEHTSKAFIGLTTNCAKCHDHKYDPITQVDYYRMRAIFEPHQVRLDPLPGTLDLKQDGLPRVFDAHPDAKTHVHIRGNEKEPDLKNPLTPNVPSFFKYKKFTPVTRKLPVESYLPATQEFVIKDQLLSLDKAIESARAADKAAREELEKFAADSVAEKKVFYNKHPFDSKSYWFHDDFELLDKSKWSFHGGSWNVKDGKLLQTDVGATSRMAQLEEETPTDFLAEVQMSVSGGDMWKSFGLRFDVSDKHSKTVYLSAFSDSKIQISFSENGKTTYPTNALSKIPVNLNQTYTLRIAITGQTINASVDGKHLVSYDFPVPRKAGKIQLMSFDSVASFDSIWIAKLPKNVALFSSKNGQRLTKSQAGKNVELMQAKLTEAIAKREKVQTAIQADIAQAELSHRFAAIKNGGEETPEIAVVKAAQANANFQLAKLNVQRLETEYKLISAAGSEKQKLEKKLVSIDAKTVAAKNLVAKPETRYESVRVSQKGLEGPAEKEKSRNQRFPKISTGRRTALAKWMTDSSHPLTARVAVNQIWMRHLGRPLVDPVTDFGRRAKAPVQQKLLDWLAVELMENGWKMKRIHKLIVTSKAYRMSGKLSHEDRIQQATAEEYYLIRSPIRMESQVVRDSLLKLSGQLKEQLGGPPIDPNRQANSNRRSLYFRQSRDHQHKFIGMFDDADILRCYRRQESIIPQQALTLVNSKLAFQSAQKISQALSAKTRTQDEFIDQAFQTILSRSPSPEEELICRQSLETLDKLAAKQPKNDGRSRANFVLALINSNDFVMIR